MLTNKRTLKALLIVAFITQDRRLAAERRHSVALALTISNVEAEHDSTRELRRTDSIRWFTRRIV